MEEISTRHTHLSEAVAGSQAKAYSLTGRFISFLLKLYYGLFMPVQKVARSLMGHSLPTLKSANSSVTQRLVEGFAGSVGEPPDVGGSSPPGFRDQHLQKASNYFAQHPMNEQIILLKSFGEEFPHPVSDSGGGPSPAKPAGVSSFSELLSSFVSYAHGSPVLKGACSVLTLLWLWLAIAPAHAQAPAKINLQLHKTISNQSPAIGDIVTYTVVVSNAPGSATATNVLVKDELPIGGVTYVPNSATTLRGSATFNSVVSATVVTGLWNIASIAPGDSAVMILKATVNERGVWFNTAEVAGAGQTDTNSIPNNQSPTEDDFDAVCFSVPIFWYVGDEYTVTIPTGYDEIVWYRNDTAIVPTAVSTLLAEVNSDQSLTIKSPGVYRFVTYRTGCPATNCCDIQVIPGPYGSLGDYVFADANKNGAQDVGETGIDGVKVYLYDQLGTTRLDSTVTTGGGKYLFDSLTDGSYVVRFMAPSGYESTTANAVGISDALDSDAGANGFTGVYTIDTSQPTSSTARNNPTVDAGYFMPTASLGDFVFEDTNKDGIQQPGEPGIPGVVVTLYVNGVSSLTTLTNSSGLYSFTGLTPGSSLSYSVGFTAPSGFTATLANQGSDGTKDSDIDPITGRTQSVTLAAGETNTTLDAGFLPTCPVNFSLVVSNDATICNGDKAVLTASTPFSYVRWYLTPYGGTAFDTLSISKQSLIVSPTTTTVYYAEAVTQDGSCVSVRKPVVITVTTVPTPIALGNIKNSCPSTTVDLTKIAIENSTTGLVYEWYTSMNRSIATRVTNLTAVGAGKLYLFAKSGACYSNPTVLTVEITNCACQEVAGVNVGQGVAVCSGDAVPLKAVLSGSATSVVWTTSGTGTFSSPTSLSTTYMPSVADITTGNVVLTATTNDPDGPGGVCQTASSSLIAQINKRPEAPVNVAVEDALVCQGSSTKLVALAPGSKINWYDQDNKLIGTTESGEKLVVTPTKAGALIYMAEALSSAGCVSPRTSLTVTVGPCLADLGVVKEVVTPGTYSVGQKITYAITVTNNGPVTANSVKVTDMLPATLTFVGATPVGQYNAATGIWTIGTMASKANRSLLVEATINAAGSITNTAIVSSPDNDPKYTKNDTSSVTIPVVPCSVKPPTLACAITEICKGGTTTLTARGCEGGSVLWSNGKTGDLIFVAPSVTTTYTASCVVGACTSAVSNAITVTVVEPQVPVITASADNVCPGTSVTLTASGCVGGTIVWSDKAQTGTSIVVTPYGKTTYTAQCVIGSCPSNPATKTINITTDLPTPTIVCSTTVVCPGETVTLTVENCVGTPYWSNTTATTGSIIVTPTIGNNSYSVYCKTDGGCVSKTSAVYTINVVAPTVPTVTASTDTVCVKGAVTLTATNCNGTVKWNVANQTGPSIVVNPTANISYFAWCESRTCQSKPSNTVNITVITPTAPIVSVSSTTLCSGNKLTLTAKGCTGTVKWYGMDGVAKIGASIDIFPTATATYYATCQVGSTCESEASNKVRVTVSTSTTPAPVIAASSLSICSGGLVSLTATGCLGGTVKWSDGQTGPVAQVTVTPSNREFYALCMPTSASACGSGKSNVITINVTPLPKPTVTCSTDTICRGETVTLTVNNCLGTPRWSSTTATTGSIVVSPTVTTSYSVFCSNGTCTSETSNQYTITVIPAAIPTITASATAVAPGGTVTLTASGCNGEVIWSANDINGNNKGAVIVVRPEGTQTYYAQCKFHTCLSDPSVTVVINPGNCVVKAGTLVATNGIVCGGTSTTVTVSASPNGGLVQPAGYSVLYVLTKGAQKVIQQTSATPQFSVSSDAGEYTIHTLVYNANAGDKNYLDLSVVKPGITTAAEVLLLIGNKCAALDVAGAPVKVKVIEPPVLSTTASATVCYGSTVTFTASGCEGGVVTWSDGSIGKTIQKTAYSTLWLMATCTIDGCTSKSSKDLDVEVATPAIPIIVSNAPAVCVSETVSLTATGCVGGTYVWSDNKTVGSTLTITPTADVSYRVRCKVGDCLGDWSAYTTIKVGTPAAPTISVAGSTSNVTTCFGTPVTLVAEGCGPNSYVTWSNNQVGSSITVSLAASAIFTAQCSNSNQCKSVPSNTIAVTVLPKVTQPVVVDKTNACPFKTVDLATAVTSKATTTGGLFEYYTNASLSSDAKVVNPAAVGTGTYYVVERTTAGCVSLPVAVHVQINTCEEPKPCDTQNPATANAGVDASICAAKTYQLSGVMGGAGKTAHWTTSGSGSFNNSYALNAIYTASAEDILSGKVTLTLTVRTDNANCPVATDNMLLTIDGIKSVPVVTLAGAANLCYGDSVTLKAPAGAAGYRWSNNATTQTIVVKTSGSYNVQLFDAKGCSSVKSDNVVVKVAEPVMPPLVTDLRNTCPSKIVDLTTALAAPKPGNSYVYRICECVTSNIVVRPDSVCEGTYWIVEKGPTGCLSAPAKVVVNVFNCATDTVGTDVSIAKTASTAFVQNGAPVVYTLKVTNNGTRTAKNIHVRDVLPKGLELLPASAANYTVSNGVLSKRIDSLRAGQSTDIVFRARITVKGKEVVNKAEITYLDNQDPNLANNSSSVTVKDTSSHRASLVGLAKAVLGQPLAVGDSLIKVSYSFVVTNFGDDTLRNVVVNDDLASVFAPNQVTSAKVTLLNTGSTLIADPTFTGQGTNKKMTSSTSYLLAGASQSFKLDLTVKRTTGDTTKVFRNTADVTALNSVTAVSDRSTSGGDADPDNDGNPANNSVVSSFTLNAGQPKGASLGLALAVIKVQQQPDSSYNVTYKATLKNFGDVALKGIVLTDSLIRTFSAPVSYSVVGAPVVGAGSTLVANAGFNGNSQPTILTKASQLGVGVQDTVLITVNVKTNGNYGPFYSSATVVGHTPDSSQVVKDISNSGFNPAPAGSAATTVRFDLPKGLIGVAKSVGTPVLVSTGVYDIPYTITVSNLGSVPLKKVQVVDNLSQTFGHGALIVSNQVSVTSTGTVVVNPAYTGQGLVTKMLVDSVSTLAVGAKSHLSFTVRVDVRNADSLTFFNRADASALTPANEVVQDMSTAGTNDDPDNDLDPRNNSQPTPIALNGSSTTSYIGLAMAVRDTAQQTDGSVNVTYQIVVRNYGPDVLKNVSITDSLSNVFNAKTGATYKVVKPAFTTSTGSALKVNLNFNGGSDPVLVLGDSTSVLAVGKTDTLLLVVNVVSNGTTTTFLNTAYATATAKTGTVSDVSTSGLNPDLNGNGNPTDSNEREATPLNLRPVFQSLFIPEGFSPNGDGINDLFVIRGVAGLTVSLEVYNRWGHLVYKSDDYHNDWDGKPNAGIALNSDANGVPDGTYYYVINTSDGRKFVRYMTINR
ncbi:conserved repeat domain-containing protein/gliding motility-associated C-terminal domain-containing protein [Spirosoma fluviale]|uniref:Conserved repeat domain-containing protein/gliding motility-associated C-terminal domain-containing protein n=2 Tax=Spirosoma fluviale TaxID=1597977 RepID=A0A286GE63_9BACT|nr:conserved repeat domain-containing protein/gliding motility-associated C-terminal domain-containing protein [Spirosoma fluviale]